MAIYTKRGDKGTTSLPFEVRRRSKSNCRVRALGEIDELNSLIGAVVAFSTSQRISSLLIAVQHDLFRVQLDLASKGKIFKESHITPIGQSHITRLEKQIDAMQAKLTPLSMFILPGGSRAGALAHVARAVCRRAERELAALKAKERINPDVAKYMNRLSDFLFVIARFLNKQKGYKESYPDYYQGSIKQG